MREIAVLVVHCSATRPDQDIGAADIDRWHKERGWSGIGYHAVIRRDGTLERGRNPQRSGAHAKGYNQNSLGICLAGGVDSDGQPDANFTPHQYRTLWKWINEVEYWYGSLEVLGHRDLEGVTKSCPCFDVQSWMESYDVEV